MFPRPYVNKAKNDVLVCNLKVLCFQFSKYNTTNVSKMALCKDK